MVLESGGPSTGEEGPTVELVLVIAVALVMIGAVVTIGRLIQRSGNVADPDSATADAEIQRARAHGIGGSWHSGPV
jgi:hypothetical protein